VEKSSLKCSELPTDEKGELLKELGMKEPGLNRVIRAGYDLLGLQTFFTAGGKRGPSLGIPKKDGKLLKQLVSFILTLSVASLS